MTQQLNRSRRQMMQGLGVGLVLFLAATAWADDYPTKPIELVVPASAGGGTDAMARNFAEIVKKDTASPLASR